MEDLPTTVMTDEEARAATLADMRYSLDAFQLNVGVLKELAFGKEHGYEI